LCEPGLGQRRHSPERTRRLQGYLWIANVKDACRLHGQQDEEFFHGWSRWLDDTNAKFLRARNHLPEQLIHGVGVHAGAIRNARPQVRSHLPQEARCCRSVDILRIVGKNAPQILVIVVRPVPSKILTLLRVVLTQSAP
jgi:hypothetical protein